MLGLFFASLALAQYGSTHFRDANFYLLPSRGWELLAGALVGQVMHGTAGRNGTLKRFGVMDEILTAVGLAMIVISIVLFYDTMRHPSLITAIPIVGTVLVIGFAGSGGMVTRLLSSRPFVSIGLISYSFYLWHFPVFAFARIWIGTLDVGDKFILIAISFALAALTYTLIEQPLRRRDVISKKTLYFFCGSITAALIIGFGLVYTGKLVPYRYVILETMVNFKYDPNEDWREGTCFIQPQNMQQPDVFRNCEISNYDSNKPVLLLWGDSQAAHFYRGYEQEFGGEYNILQLTSSLCAPLPGRNVSNRPGCKEINDDVLDMIVRTRPDKVLLSAAWSVTMIDDVRNTIDTLRKAGIDDIEIIGPVPKWETTLPDQIARYVDKHHSFPERLSTGQSPYPYDANDALHALTEEMDVPYYSPIDILCPDRNCQTRVGKTPDSITQFDTAHLTRQGAIFVVGKIKEEKARSAQQN